MILLSVIIAVIDLFIMISLYKPVIHYFSFTNLLPCLLNVFF